MGKGEASCLYLVPDCFFLMHVAKIVLEDGTCQSKYKEAKD